MKGWQGVGVMCEIFVLFFVFVLIWNCGRCQMSYLWSFPWPSLSAARLLGEAVITGMAAKCFQPLQSVAPEWQTFGNCDSVVVQHAKDLFSWIPKYLHIPYKTGMLWFCLLCLKYVLIEQDHEREKFIVLEKDLMRRFQNHSKTVSYLVCMRILLCMPVSHEDMFVWGYS